ncbi:uncharacterized protein BDFB_009073, partial [Asbolus verrucosus]
MRGLLVFGLIALLAQAITYDIKPHKVDKIEPYVFEDMINQTIEGLRQNIPDPLLISNLSINLPEGGVLVGDANVSNLELTGLQGFQVPYLNLAMIGMRLNFTFVFPLINVNTDYWADVLLAELIPVYGNGRANVHLTDIEIQGSAQAQLGDVIAVKNLRIQLYLGTATFDVHGLLDNEDFSTIVNEMLTDMVASFIDNHQKFISDTFSPIIEELINGILNDDLKAVDSIIDIINGTFEELRKSIPEPINIDKLDLSFSESFVSETHCSGSLSIANTEVKGVKAFQIPSMSLTMIGMIINFTLVLPTIDITSDYLADTVLMELLPIFGEGDASIHLGGLTVIGSTQANLTGGIQLKNFWMQIGLDEFDIKGLLYDETFSALTNYLLNNLVIPFLDDFHETITQVLSPTVQDLINQILAGSDIEPYSLIDILNQTIEGLRPNIPDPLDIERLQLTLTDPSLKQVLLFLLFIAYNNFHCSGSVKINGFDLKGLRSFQVPDLTLTMVGMWINFTMVIPDIDLWTYYGIDLTLSEMVPLYAQGHIKVNLGGFTVTGCTQANLTGGMQLKNLRLALDLDDAEFEITGLLYNEILSQIVSWVVSNLIVPIIRDFQEPITEFISPVAQDLINNLLNNNTDTYEWLEFPN